MTTAATPSGPGEEYYRANYRSYDRQNPDHKLAYYRAQIERFRDPAQPRRIHDMGCGPGNFLAGMGGDWSVFGSDINTYAIERAQAQIPGGHFALGSGAVEKLFDERFGVMTAFDVLEHVPDIERAGRNIGEQLLPGALLLFVVPVYDGLSGPVVQLLDHDPTHVHKRPRAFWIEWASRHFDIVSWEGLTRYLLPGGYYLHFASSAWRQHTPAICVACRSRDAARR
jgi:SAM-dependent methyltransferase